MRYALIKDGIVSNVIWLYPGNATDFQNAVACNDTPVSIGDTYTDGEFYRDGVKVMSAEEEYAEATRILLGEV